RTKQPLPHEKECRLRKSFVSTLVLVLGAVVAFAGGLVALSRSTVRPAAVVVAICAMGLSVLVAPPISSPHRLTLTIAVGAALPFALTAGESVDTAGIIGIYLVGSIVVAIVEWARRGSLGAAIKFAARGFISYAVFLAVFASIRALLGSS